MTKESIIDKIKKLIVLAESTNFEAEGATCMERVRELMAQYQLEMSDIRDHQKDGGVVDLAFEQSYGRWQLALAQIVADYTGCKYFRSWKLKGRRYKKIIKFVGIDWQVDICLSAYTVLYRQVRQLVRTKRKELRKQSERTGARDRMATTYLIRGYSLGILDELAKKLKEKKWKESQSESGALVLSIDKRVLDWCIINLSKPKQGKGFSYSNILRGAGQKDGQSVSVNEGIRRGMKNPIAEIE